MVWFLAIFGIAAVFGLAAVIAWGVREMLRSTAVTMLERRLHPNDVRDLNQAFARIQREVLSGD